MENLSQLKSSCLASTKTYFQAQRLSTNITAKSICNSKWWSKMAIKALSTVLNFLLIAGSCLLTSFFILYHCKAPHEEIGEPLDRISRFISLTLDLHKLPNLQDAHYKSCFLYNPYYEENRANCRKCSKVKEVIGFTELNEYKFRKNFPHNAIPFVLKNSFQTPINLDSLNELLSKNLEFENYPTDKYSHMELQINPTNISRIFRKIFPAPAFLPLKTELHFQQTIFIDGPSAPEYSLLPTYSENTIVLQAKGRRVVKLLPVWHCTSTCSSISVELEPGDVLHFTAYFWRAFSQPVYDNREDFSITNLGSFSLNEFSIYLNKI